MSDTERQHRVRTLAEVRQDRTLLRDSLARIADGVEEIAAELRRERKQWDGFRRAVLDVLTDAKQASDTKADAADDRSKYRPTGRTYGKDDAAGH